MKRKFFGWIEEKEVRPQHEDVLLAGGSPYLEWRGPKSLFLVWIALLCYQEKIIHIPRFGWIAWEKNGFFGDGLAFFKKS